MLNELLQKYAAIKENGFDIDLESAPEEWNKWIMSMGVRRACALMSDGLCERYKQMFGKEFLFTNRCVAYELEYHIDGYMYAKGFKGYHRNITTLLFSREKLIAHCREINISTNDVKSWKQRTMFRYKSGVRKEYQKTESDPFNR